MGTPIHGLAAVLTAGALSCSPAILCGAALPDVTPFYANTFAKTPTVAAMTDIGRALFFDRSLSSSGKVACATCHDPRSAFGPRNNRPVQRGGGDGRQFGVRAAPSLTYGQNIPAFTEHYFDDDGDDSADQGPAGGRSWDGRSQSAHDQARMPLFSPFEMANRSVDAVITKVQSAGYAAQFRDAFGEKVFDDTASAFKGVLMALETFQQSPAEFYPYSSKYDAWLRHETSLSGAELRGLAAFNDPARGNCARCHPSGMRKGAFPQFTDFGYSAIGAPRNAAIPANADGHYYDLGLCGPLRSDLKDQKRYCGLFRTPTLRNVAARRSFFHNGVLHRLEDVIRFYAERDTQPQKWYPHEANGAARKFDDLPLQYQENVDTRPPFDRHAGEAPALSEADIRDIAAFLNALTDGYDLGRGAAGSAASASVLMSLNITCGCKKASE
ncbi:MAG TPA: cytochrome c peroxidase [Steroidobacteraceae bacterium]|nr:cytochrome c peroxidase [Steroidobacteraceae bacterium]